MSHDDESFEGREWSAEERARLDALSAERIPPAAMKDRTIAALHARSLLRRGRPRSTPFAIGLAAAAAIVFAAGVAVGYSFAGRRAVDQLIQPSAAREMVRADSVAVPRPARQVVWF
jgi:hypothetical protein